MIQYAKLHQKDVISVIIPNFFSSPYGLLLSTLIGHQISVHVGVGFVCDAFRSDDRWAVYSGVPQSPAPLWLRCRGRSWLALYRLSLTLSLQTRCDAERSGKCGEHREDYLYNGLPFFLFHSDCPFFSD